MSHKVKVIMLISEGRSGTNGLYRHLFANKMEKPEPYKDVPTKRRELFKQSLQANMAAFKRFQIIHIKPQHMWSSSFGKLTPQELVDVCLECGITSFIVITRKNILARLASEPNTGAKYKKQVTISPDRLRAKLEKKDLFEREISGYISSKKEATLVNLIYEEHMKRDMNVACEMVTSAFSWLPKLYLTYGETKEDTKKLKPCAQNNNLLDKRPLKDRIENVNEIKLILKNRQALWMLDA